MCKKSGGLPLTWPQMKHAILRNFGGLKSNELNPFEEFGLQLNNMAKEETNPDNYEDVENVCTLLVYACLKLLFLCSNRCGQLFIQIAQG